MRRTLTEADLALSIAGICEVHDPYASNAMDPNDSDFKINYGDPKKYGYILKGGKWALPAQGMKEGQAYSGDGHPGFPLTATSSGQSEQAIADEDEIHPGDMDQPEPGSGDRSAVDMTTAGGLPKMVAPLGEQEGNWLRPMSSGWVRKPPVVIKNETNSGQPIHDVGTLPNSMSGVGNGSMRESLEHLEEELRALKRLL